MMKLTHNADSFAASIESWAEQIKNRIENTIRDAISEASSRMIMGSPVDTGLLRGNWQVSRVWETTSPLDLQPGKVMSRAQGKMLQRGAGVYDKSGKNTIAKANAVIKTLPIKDGIICYIFNNTRYAIYVEYGPPYPRGMVRKVIAEWPAIVAQAARKNKL